MPNAAVAENAEGFDKLFLGHSEFGVGEMPDDVVRDLKSARIVPTANRVGQRAASGAQVFNLRQVVEIDHGAEAHRLAVFLGAGLVGGKQNILSEDSAFLRQHQFGERGAVNAAAERRKQTENRGRRRRLDGEVFLKTAIP